MKSLPKWLGLAGVLAAVAGVLVGFLPMTVQYDWAGGTDSASCGSVWDGSNAAIEESSASRILPGYVPGTITTACHGAYLTWLPWVLIVLGAALILTAAILGGMRRANAATPPSPASAPPA